MNIPIPYPSVGSTNFDDRSFEINDEITLGIWSQTLAKKLEEIFEEDLAYCTELSLEKWNSRGILH
ncbi:MAG TPA: phospholipase D-like domain-containing protein [Thermoanaerobaculia bacterium]|nr:phospholipase D-like domain-containing protein [Thermoanaerobaculia bacterium]